MSDDLWKEMMNKEKLKFKDIEVHYARLLEKRKVSLALSTISHQYQPTLSFNISMNLS